jgi:hypothetical protein
MGVLLVEPVQQFGEGGGLDLPAHLGAAKGRPLHQHRVEIGGDEVDLGRRHAVSRRHSLGSPRLIRHGLGRVVVDAEKVERPGDHL